MQYRHVQIYLETSTELLDGYREYAPDVPKSYTSEKAKANWLASWREETAPGKLHCVQMTGVQAVVFDFETSEMESLYACPGENATYYHISVEKTSKVSVAAQFFKQLDAIVRQRGFSSLHSDRISYRSSKGSFDRHLLRVETMRSRRGNVFDKIEPLLYLKLTSFDWNSILGPDVAGDSEILARQMGLWDSRADSDRESERVKGRLQTTINIYERIRAVPYVEIK